jgi:hypothetical protein
VSRGFYGVTYALLVAKSALELEINNYPATEEVFQRLGKAVETPDVLRSASRALLEVLQLRSRRRRGSHRRAKKAFDAQSS